MIDRCAPGLVVALMLAGCDPAPSGAVDADHVDDAGVIAPEAWRYLAVPAARCANGTETGIGISLAPSSDTAVIFVQGGGACWEGLACYGLGTATHFMDTVQEATVLAEATAPAMARLFDRTRADNPFPTASLAYVPYCTGDLHAGTRMNTYDYLGPRVAHHVGALNMDAYLARLVPMMPGVRHVILMGISAGGFGATLNWQRVQNAFGAGVRVDLLDDCGPAIDVAGDGRWGTMKAAWGLSLPAGCADCGQGFSRLLPYYATAMPPASRYGLMAFRGDDVIGTFFGLDDATQAQRLGALIANAAPNQRVFQLVGNQHVMLAESREPTTSTGVTLTTWMTQFFTDDPAWAHQGP